MIKQDTEISQENESKCQTCDKKDTACISIFAHENAIMHKDMDNERAHKSNLYFAVTVLLITLIFVIAYTIRMNAFVDVIKEMNADIVKLANAKGVISP